MFAAEVVGLRAQALGQLERAQHAITRGLRQMLQLRCFHVHGEPFAVQRVGQPPRAAHELFRECIRTDAHQHALPRCPGAGDGVVLAIFAHRRIDAIGGRAQRELAQGDQVALAEERIDRVPCLLRQVHLAFVQASDQIIRWQIDQLDFVGAFEHAVGHGFAHAHAGDLRNHVVEAFHVLHVDRGVDIDAGIEQFHHILPALGVARAGVVGVRQLIDQQQRGAAQQRGIEIELRERDAAMLQPLRRQDLQAFEQRLGFRAAVQLDIADDHVDARGGLLARGFEHGIGLADARRRAEKYLQMTARRCAGLALHALQKYVGIGSRIGMLGGHASAWVVAMTPMVDARVPRRQPGVVQRRDHNPSRRGFTLAC